MPGCPATTEETDTPASSDHQEDLVEVSFESVEEPKQDDAPIGFGSEPEAGGPGEADVVVDCTVVGQCTEHRQRMRTTNREPWRLGNLALPVHYVMSGVLLNVAQGLLYGVLLGTMAVPGRVYATARIFVLAPWCLKCLFGWVSDCFPINGYHRKFYSAYGWFVSGVAHLLLCLIFTEPAVPKYCPDTGHGDLGNYVPEAGVCNPDADAHAHTLTVLMSLSVLGTTLAESAADGLTMECAQSWNRSEARGKILMQSMALRLLGASLGSCFLAVCFNARRHLGWFDWELSFATINWGLAGLGLAMMLLWTCCAQEDVPEIAPRKCADCCQGCCGTGVAGKCFKACLPGYRGGRTPQSIMVPTNTFHNASTHCQDAWKMHTRVASTLCTSLFAKFLLFQLLSSILSWSVSPGIDMMKRYWAGVQQMQEQLGDVVESLVFTLAITVGQGVLLSVEWRSLTVIGAVVGCIGTVAIGTVTALGLFRDQYFYLVIDLFLQIPRAVNFLIGTWIVAEISPERLEATIFGVVASVHSLAPVLARALVNPLYAQLPPMASHLPPGSLSEASYYAADTKPFQMSVAVSVWSGAALTALPAMLVLLLPANSIQARTAMVLKMNQYSRCCGSYWLPSTCNQIRWYTGAGLCLALFVLAVAGTLLALLPNAKCSTSVGGSGC